MRRAGRTVILVALQVAALAWSNAASGALIPSPLRGIVISAAVLRESTGIFVYRYHVFNPPVNNGPVSHIQIDIVRKPDEAELSREGLINGPGYFRNVSENAFQRVPMVPVGINGPNGWIYVLGFDDQTTPPQGFVSWGAIISANSMIGPGTGLTGFELVSYGLPGIRNVEVLPDVDYTNLPYPEFHDVEKVRQLQDSLTFRTKTVAPKAPPKNFVAVKFLNYLITLVYDSRQLGWIKVDGVQQSLLTKLINAKRKLEAGQTAVAKNMLDAFLHEVSGASCQEFS